MIRRYSELVKLPTFEERFAYLRLTGQVGKETFGFDRYLNQRFYTSKEWRQLRSMIIARDLGCDLATPGFEIPEKLIIIHHLNPITEKDLLELTDFLFDPEYLVCTRHVTHNAIHYGGDAKLLTTAPTVRTPNDTSPWRK